MKIIYKKTSELIPYARNNKTHDEFQIKKIASSIKEFGFKQPVIVDSENSIIAGHGRIKAAELLKMEKIPCIVADDLTKAQVKAYRIADNKLNTLSDWDDEMLGLELEELGELDFDISLTGFGIDEVEALSNVIEGSLEGGQEENPYTNKIKAPLYEPNNEKPEIEDLYTTEKYDSLIEQINKSKIPEEEKAFLKIAAQRHIVFNYKLIADFYSHSKKETQENMENSALVIIDFDKAIENGYVKLSEEIAKQYGGQNG